MTPSNVKLRRALISVSDKAGLEELAEALVGWNIELVSTGGTAAALKSKGYNVRDVSDLTGFPEMMDGRVKTLHPAVHGGLLGVRDNPEHASQANEHGITPIDLLIVNLYPFEETVAKGGDIDTCIENMDIGGPAMIRSGAKNHASVTTIVDTGDYAALLEELASNEGATSFAFRRQMAQKAIARTSAYDAAISNWLGAIVDNPNDDPSGYPRTYTVQFQKKMGLRYGENPHQSAAFYVSKNANAGSVSTSKQLLGKELSFNNIADTDAAVECVKAFTEKPACVIVKHANPCGVACADTMLAAYDRAYKTDSESAFGGIIAFNRELDQETAAAIVERQFVEVIVAPSVTEAAYEAISIKKNVRLLTTGPFPEKPVPRHELRPVNGGLLMQDADLELLADQRVVTERQPTETELEDMRLAWKVAKYVKSNAIVFAKDQATSGIGAGQMSRVNSTRIATIKAEMAGLDLNGSALASDAFFPFADGLIAAADAGATAIIQPGGSIRDEDVIKTANERGLAMIFTGMRHFRH